MSAAPGRHLRIERHPGLYLDVRGEGRAAWPIRYRPKPKANQRWCTLSEDAAHADFDEISRKASELLTALRVHGIDPHARKEKAAAAQKTFTECFKLWLDHMGKRREKPLSPSTRAGYEDLFDLHIKRHLGKRSLSDLDRAGVELLLKKVKAATTNAEKGHRGVQATKVLKLISSICEWCIDEEWLDRNPCRGIKAPVPIAPPNGKQSRPPTDAELRQLWNDGPDVMSAAQTRVLRLAILIGRRISEIVGTARDDAKLDGAIPCLFIPAPREGNKPKLDDAVPLPPLALSIVQEALATSKAGEPLFVGAATRWTTSKVLTTTRRSWKWPDPPVRFHGSHQQSDGGPGHSDRASQPHAPPHRRPAAAREHSLLRLRFSARASACSSGRRGCWRLWRTGSLRVCGGRTRRWYMVSFCLHGCKCAANDWEAGTADGLHGIGAIDKRTMREFDVMCLTMVEELSARYPKVSRRKPA